MRITCSGILLVMISAIIAGCGGDDRPPIGFVTGTIVNDGTPVVGSTIEFFPSDGRPSMGITDENGKYTLYYAVGEPGARIGVHKVLLSAGQSAPKEDDSAAPRKPMPRPKKGKQLLTLSENTEVKAGDNEINFDVATLN